MPANVTLRGQKGSALTHTEMDNNFASLRDTVNTVEGAVATANTAIAAKADATATANALASKADASATATALAAKADTTALALKQDIASSVETLGGNATLTLARKDTYLRFSAAATLTVPTNTAHAHAIGTSISGIALTSGKVTIAPQDGTVTINKAGALTTRAAMSGFTLTKVGTNEWDLIGDMG